MTLNLSNQEFIRLYQMHGTKVLARELGVSERTVQRRRSKIEGEIGTSLLPPSLYREPRNARKELQIPNGVVLVGSDAHYWPSDPSTAHRAFVHVANELQPDVIVMNGDVIDASTISRYPPIGWEQAPFVKQEIEVAQERLEEIENAAPNAKRIWTLGNHDARFETRLATVAPEYRGVLGIHLRDHFPNWVPAYSVEVNNNVMIKHRFKGGVHAAYNNVMKSGRTIVTGHLHSLQVKPYTDYNGTRWGVDSGMLGDPLGPQFTGYTEDNPLDWRSGFVILRFKDWEVRPPELVSVIRPGLVDYRGKDLEV